MTVSFPKARHMARVRALQALYQWQLAGHSIQEIELQFLSGQDMTRADVPYFQKLLRQIPMQVSTLDDQIKPLLDRDIAQIDPVEHAIFYIGCYELLHSKDVSRWVIINEAVELAKKFGANQSYKYINGVLDKVAQQIRPHEHKTHKKFVKKQ